MCTHLMHISQFELLITISSLNILQLQYRPVVAIGAGQLFCLAMSRMSAFSLYPPMILVFLTKCKACIDRLNKTPFSMHMTKDITNYIPIVEDISPLMYGYMHSFIC